MATVRDLKGILIFSSGLYDRKNNKTGDFPGKHGERVLVIYGVVNDSVVRTEAKSEGAHGKVHFIISSSWSQSESAPVSEAGRVLSLEEGPGIPRRQRQPRPAELCCLHPSGC